MTHSPLGTALITGASAGIGATYADRLSRRGYDLILVARDAARLDGIAKSLREETGRRIEVLRADLTDPAELDVVAGRLASDSAITLLVNNAGMSLAGNALTSEAAAVTKLVALNVNAPAILATAAGKAFAARGTGAIINIASVLGLVAERFDGAYNGTKSFLLTLSKWLSAELGPKGVHVQAVLPGATRTEIWERSGQDIDAFPPEMVMAVEDLVDAALVGFDRRETVTIPPLADEALYRAYEDARLAMGPHLSRREVAERYRSLEVA
jgi:short-subunit dehydrogenase